MTASRSAFDPTDIFAALNRRRVKYLVVGGIAVVLHGVNRFTWDVDLSVELTVGNLGRLMEAMRDLGFERRVPAPIEGLADPKVRRLWTQRRGMKVYSFFESQPPARVIDVMVKPLAQFDRVYGRRVTVRAKGVSIPLVPVDVLLRMKREAGRPEDLFDIAQLKALKRMRPR